MFYAIVLFYFQETFYESIYVSYTLDELYLNYG